MTLDMDELRDAEVLLGKMAAHAEKILPVLERLEAGKYVADSGNQKFRLSAVERVPSTTPPKPKIFNFRRKSA